MGWWVWVRGGLGMGWCCDTHGFTHVLPYSQFTITHIQGHTTTTWTPQQPSCPAFLLPLVMILYLTLSLNDHLHVPPSLSTRLAPGPCPLECNCSSPNHNHVYSSLSAHLRPLPYPLKHDCSPPCLPCLFEPGHSCPTLTMSIQVQPLTSRLNCIYSSVNTPLPH